MSVAAVTVEVQYPFVHIVTEPAKYLPAGQLITPEHLCVHGVLFVMNSDIRIIIRLVLPAMAVAENFKIRKDVLMFCENCRTELLESFNFCTNCGYAVNGKRPIANREPKSLINRILKIIAVFFGSILLLVTSFYLILFTIDLILYMLSLG